MEPTTNTTINEIADGIYRISTLLPEMTPEGFSFNQFLVVADEPLLYHAGPRGMFPLVAEQVQKVIPVDSLRWISFGHVEADECGSMNMWLASAPSAQVVHSGLACMVSLNDLCDRPPVPLGNGETLDLGGKRIRLIETPHVPHGWEAISLYEETTNTLLCGDLAGQLGGTIALTTDDIVEGAIRAEEMFGYSCLSPQTGTTLRSLGDLNPTTLAIMHGSSFSGDGKRVLHDLADAYDRMGQRVSINSV